MMLERWLIATLFIGALIALRMLMTRYIAPRLIGSDSKTNIDACMASGCKSARSSCGKK
jgi:hypothetical protein